MNYGRLWRRGVKSPYPDFQRNYKPQTLFEFETVLTVSKNSHEIQRRSELLILYYYKYETHKCIKGQVELQNTVFWVSIKENETYFDERRCPP